MVFNFRAVVAWGARLSAGLGPAAGRRLLVALLPDAVRPFHDSAYVYECFHYFYR